MTQADDSQEMVSFGSPDKPFKQPKTWLGIGKYQRCKFKRLTRNVTPEMAAAADIAVQKLLDEAYPPPKPKKPRVANAQFMKMNRTKGRHHPTTGKLRGFAAMTPERLREISARGARIAALTGNAHRFDSVSGGEAGRKAQAMGVGNSFQRGDADTRSAGSKGGTSRALNAGQKIRNA